MFKKSGVISSKQLTFAGWLSIALGIVTVPYTAVFIFVAFAFPEEATFNPIATALSAVYTAAYVYLFFFLKKFLNVKFNFHKVDRVITLLIVLEIILFLLAEASVFVPEVGFAIFALLVAFGILSIMLGVRLLGLKDDLFGLLRPLSYNLIAIGVLMATVILIFFALIPLVVLHIILGIIFLRFASK